MLDAVMAVVAVLAGAVATFAFQRLRAERERREILMKRYLAQLQDASESLWYRLRNLAYERASLVSEPDYLVVTTMYTLGRALGIERMLALEGLYSEIWRRFPTLKGVLARRLIDEGVKQMTAKKVELQHYDRVTLAEAVVERHGEGFHPSTFLEFRRRVEAYGPEYRWWQPARTSVSALQDSRDVVRSLMDQLRGLAIALAAVTEMDSSLAEERCPARINSAESA
jgi:hypothetical protein